MNIEVRVLDARRRRDPRALSIAEIRQQTKLVVGKHVGFDTQTGAANQKRVDVRVVDAIQEGPVIRLDLTGESQREPVVGGAKKEAALVIPAGQGTAAIARLVRQQISFAVRGSFWRCSFGLSQGIVRV